MQNVERHLPGVVVALIAITTASLASAAYNFADLNYPGMQSSSALGCNNKGLVAGTSWSDDTGDIAWVYDPKAEGFTQLPPLSPCLGQAALGINESGIIVGSCYVSDSLDEGFILNKKNEYMFLNYPGFEHTYPRAISKTGVVTGFAIDNWENYNQVGFIYDPKSRAFTDINFPDIDFPVPAPPLTPYMPYTMVQGITANGFVVGSVLLVNSDWTWADYFGFVSEPSGAVTYFQVNGQSTMARGINDAGAITGFFFRADDWAQVGFVGTLPKLGGFQTMTNAQEFVVPFEGAIWTTPEEINNSGTIVGIWGDESGAQRAFIATPVNKGKK